MIDSAATGSNVWGETPLHAAARADDRAALGRALAAEAIERAEGVALIERRDALGFTALHVASCEASAGLVANLLAAGVAVDARAPHDELTPLMLAVARGRLATVEALLASGADANAVGDPFLFSMISCAARGGSLAVLERLVAGGLALRPPQATAYFRLALELTGHGVHYVETGCCRGIAGDTEDVWAVDRPMTVPAALMAPLAALEPWLASAADGLAEARWFSPGYAASFRVDPERFAASVDLEPPGREPVPVTEVAHEMRCGRAAATAPSGTDGSGWSPLARAVSNERPALVLALVRSAALDPAALAAESDEEAARRAPERSLYPVHLHLFRELLRQAQRTS